ncbi:MAG: tripartite tricarboxylate transporter substrate-binding protein, partial [Pseudolabrys sp.]
PKRAVMIPNVPSIDEAGLPGVYASIWIGMLAPAGTPPSIIVTLSKLINEALKSPDVAQQIQSQGMELLGGSPQDFAQQIKSDSMRWDAVLQATGLGR